MPVSGPRIAFLIPAPDFSEPWRWAFDAEASALVAGGAKVDPISWTDAGELSGYDLVLPLVTWGYHLRYREWLGFLDRLEQEQARLVNPPALLRWNSHKSYLEELGSAGVPTVPTISVEACSARHIAEARARFGMRDLVIKPPVSGGATGTFRLGAEDRLPADTEGSATIIQPFVETIASTGEYSLMLFDGAPSHCVVKRPRSGDFRVQPHLGGTTTACDPPPGALQLAQAALTAAPAQATYARVDMIADDQGGLMIMELELVEPALFLDLAADGGAAFTRAILSAAERASK